MQVYFRAFPNSSGAWNGIDIWIYIQTYLIKSQKSRFWETGCVAALPQRGSMMQSFDVCFVMLLKIVLTLCSMLCTWIVLVDHDRSSKELWWLLLQTGCQDCSQVMSTRVTSQIAKFMGPRWDPPGSCRPLMGPILAPWTLLSGIPYSSSTYQVLHGTHKWMADAFVVQVLGIAQVCKLVDNLKTAKPWLNARVYYSHCIRNREWCAKLDWSRVQHQTIIWTTVNTVDHTDRAPSQYPKRRLSVRSRKVSKPRDLCLELSYRSEIWQALRQQCCRCACQISKRYKNVKYQSRGFETLRDLTKRRLFGYWDRALVSFNPKEIF